MPPPGDAPLAHFVHAIDHEDGFSLGSPRLSDDGSTVVVPILRTVARPRRYRPAWEAVDSVSAVETGRIDRLHVRNDSETPVLVPAGAVFVGRDTTSRGTVADVLLAPSVEQTVDVRCVQPARAIVPGDSLTLAPEVARLDLAQALLSGDQGRVWATVSGSGPEPAVGAAADSVTACQECGQVLLDSRGVVAVEVYDHPQSWQAVGPRPRGPSAANPLGLNAAKAVSVTRRFLEGLPSTAFRAAPGESRVAVDASAAFSLMGGEVVHLIAFGRDLTSSSGAAGQGTVVVPRTIDGTEAVSAAWSSDPGSDAEVAVAARPAADTMEEPQPAVVPAPPRRRKVLTTGWDASTFAALERLTHKEFGGDRSAAIRTLVRRGLKEDGYLGPRAAAPMAFAPVAPPGADSPTSEASDATLEARIREYERIADTGSYAEWLRARARREAERLRRGAAEPRFDDVSPSSPPPPEVESLPEAPEPEEIVLEVPPIPAPPPVDVRPLLRRAFAASAAGRYPEALTFFGDVLTAEPDNRTALLGRAVALRRSGKAQEALEALDAVLQVDPTNAAALLNRGRLLQERGDLPAALEAFDRLTTVAPNDWDVWLVRGDVLAKLGRRSEALQAYGEARRRNPDDEGLALRIRSLESAEAAQPLPPTLRVPLPRDVQEGQSYLVREARPNLSLRILRALAARGVPSLVISPRSPDAVRRDVGLAVVRVLELSHTPGDGRHDPTALAALGHLVHRFVQEGRGHGVVALEGLGSLVQESGSRETLLLIERVHEAVLQSHAVFLVSVAPGDLSDREVAMLERSLRSLS